MGCGEIIVITLKVKIGMGIINCSVENVLTRIYCPMGPQKRSSLNFTTALFKWAFIRIFKRIHHCFPSWKRVIPIRFAGVTEPSTFTI